MVVRWKPDRQLQLILLYVILSGITYWLPTVRGLFDGSSYTWSGWMGIGGSGIGGQYWLLLMLTTLMTSVVILGWRNKYKLFRWLLLIWFLLLVIESGTWFFSSEAVYFKGDTLGFEMALGNVIFLFDVLFLLLACIWIIRNREAKHATHAAAWTRLNRNLLILTFGLLPLQFVFLRFFDSYEITDQIGVFITILQWILLNLSFYPWKSKHNELADKKVS